MLALFIGKWISKEKFIHRKCKNLLFSILQEITSNVWCSTKSPSVGVVTSPRTASSLQTSAASLSGSMLVIGKTYKEEIDLWRTNLVVVRPINPKSHLCSFQKIFVHFRFFFQDKIGLSLNLSLFIFDNRPISVCPWIWFLWPRVLLAAVRGQWDSGGPKQGWSIFSCGAV